MPLVRRWAVSTSNFVVPRLETDSCDQSTEPNVLNSFTLKLQLSLQEISIVKLCELRVENKHCKI